MSKLDDADIFNIKVYSIIAIIIIIAIAQPDKCAYRGCNSNCANNSEYCELHRSSSRNNSRYHSSSSSSGSSSSSKYGNSSKNSYKPDGDDYDSYEDFMDDWEGVMPDGADADDFWGDW